MPSLVLFPLLLASSVSMQDYAAPAPTEPRVRVWLDADDGYVRGDRARIHVQAAADGYLVVLHADADGVVRVLFPLDPYIDDFVRGGELVEIRGRGDREAFLVDERTGSGLVLAAWSQEPFRFDELARGDHWDYRMIAPQGVAGDAEAALVDIVHAMSAGRGFDYDAAPYIVGSGSRGGGGRIAYSVGYDPWYGPRVHTSYAARSGFHLSLNLGIFAGDPWLHGAFHYDPFFTFGRPIWYRPVYYDPYYVRRVHHRVWVYDPFLWIPVPRYRHRGIGVHVRYASGWCRYDSFCGRSARPGWATGVGLASQSGWGGIGDTRWQQGIGSRDGWAGIGSGYGRSTGRIAVGTGIGASDSRLSGRATGIGARVTTGTATGSIGRSATPRAGTGSGLRGVIIGTRSAEPRGSSNASGVVSRAAGGEGRIGGRAATGTDDGSVARRGTPRTDGGVSERTGTLSERRGVTTGRTGTVSGRTGTISGRSSTISGRSSSPGRGEGTISGRTAAPRSSPPPATRSTTRRIGDAGRSDPITRPAPPTRMRASPPSTTRSGATSRLGDRSRPSPTTRPTSSRSGSGSGSVSRSAPTMRSAPSSRSSAPPRATPTRSAPTTRASAPPRAGAGRASGSASSRGSTSRRSGGRIGGNP
jgi:hypothetical protein